MPGEYRRLSRLDPRVSDGQYSKHARLAECGERNGLLNLKVLPGPPFGECDLTGADPQFNADYAGPLTEQWIRFA
jgi:hypothetical protein